jgi:hypothetical protein
MIVQAARMIFSAYRRDDFADPDTFVLQLGMVLERYPDEVIAALSSPLTGIQRRCKRPPSIADIVEGCEAILDRLPRPEPPQAVCAPIDPVMQARVARLFAELSRMLHERMQSDREQQIKDLGEREKPRRDKWYRSASNAVTIGEHGICVSSELAGIVERWKHDAEPA